MNFEALFKSFVLCLLPIAIEALSAKKEGRAWFNQLRRPKYSFSIRVWYAVGAIYYLLFGSIGYRLFSIDLEIYHPTILVLATVMIANGLSNFIIFVYRSPKWFYLTMYPFGILLLILVLLLESVDLVSAVLASIYLLWWVYDLYYGYQLWQLNTIKNTKAHGA